MLALEKNADLDAEAAVVGAIAGARFEFRQLPEGNVLHLNGRNVGAAIRTEAVGAAASKTSAYPGVRKSLLGLQRDLGAEGAVVLEGRDIGTVVFPNAEVKIFLTASIEERARRRTEELKAKGVAADPETVKREMARRDMQDATRATAPLRKSADAIEVDTSGMAIESVLDRLESIVRNAE